MKKHYRRFLRLVVYLTVPCLCLFSPSCLSRWTLFPQERVLHLPDALRLPYEDVYFDNAFGRTLHGWYIPAEDPKGSVVVYHGNFDNIGRFIDYARMLFRQRYNTLMVDYQGFGGSQGDATLLSLESDGLAACDYLLSREPSGQIGVLGVSLGTCVALAAASQRDDVAGVVLEGAFIPRQELYAKMGTIGSPLAAIINQAVPPGLDTSRLIGRLGAKPVLFVQGGDDHNTQLSGAARLFEAHGGPGWMWIVPEIGHFPDVVGNREEQYESLLGDFFDSVFCGSAFPHPSVEWNHVGGKLRVLLHYPPDAPPAYRAVLNIVTGLECSEQEVILTGTETVVELDVPGPVISVSAMCAAPAGPGDRIPEN